MIEGVYETKGGLREQDLDIYVHQVNCLGITCVGLAGGDWKYVRK